MTNEKEEKILKITALLLAVITVLTAGIIGICYSLKSNSSSVPMQAETTKPEFEYADNTTVYDMPKAMAFTAQALAAAQSNGQTVDVAIKASITPWDAANQQVDFSVAWGTAPTHGKEAVTDYVTVTQDSDGSLNATISCKKAFGSDKIIVTVTTRDGGFTANCTVSFVGVASTMSITNGTLNPISDTKRGVYYQLGTNKTAYYKNILKKNGVKVISAKEHIGEGSEGIILEAMLEGFEQANGHNSLKKSNSEFKAAISM